MFRLNCGSSSIPSPPSRRRGLKLIDGRTSPATQSVASFAEAWIEIKVFDSLHIAADVASFAEAWIEMPKLNSVSPPS